jgi:hypothetical protein
MDAFQEQEEKIRNRFIKDFNRLFICIKPTEDTYSNYDLDSTGHTKMVYKWELKERSEKYSIHQYSGRTWIEKTKLDFFKKCINENPNVHCRYFIYFPDGWISYDISGRFKVSSSEVLHVFMTNGLPSTTMGNESYKRQKMVGQLAANILEYEDKIHVNEK